MESGILGFGIRNTAPRIQNISNDENPESTAWNPESETALDSFTWGERNHEEILHIFVLHNEDYFNDPTKRKGWNLKRLLHAILHLLRKVTVTKAPSK